MDAEKYLERPYNIVIRRTVDESGDYYFATVREFDGCMSHGDTYAEAFENIQIAMRGWIETKIEIGSPVPEPFDEGRHSGKFVLRLPKSLHARLAREAERDGVSLNQYALYKLAGGEPEQEKRANLR